MIGIDPLEQRAALEEDFGVLMHLLTSDEPISIETKRYRLVDARSQYRPFTDPCFDIGVAAIASPSGPRLAGRYGVGLLSVGATISEGFDVLNLHWDVMEERAAQFGTTADRNKWRLVGPMHLAESKDRAIRDVRYGLDAFCDYTQHTIAAPHFRAAGETFDERVGWVNDTGLGVIGTPDEAIAQIERLQKQSGGFGCYLMMAHEWADPEATRRSYELFAQHVMPRLQNSASRLQASERWSASVQTGLDVLQARRSRSGPTSTPTNVPASPQACRPEAVTRPHRFARSMGVADPSQAQDDTHLFEGGNRFVPLDLRVILRRHDEGSASPRERAQRCGRHGLEEE